MESQLTILRRSVLKKLAALATESGLIIARKSSKTEVPTITQGTLACAAELVEYFSNWRKFKVTNHRTEWIYQPVKRIVDDLMQFGRWVVRNALDFLMNVGILVRRRNPGNEQDRTYQYKIDLAILDFDASRSETGSSKSENGQYQQVSSTDTENTAIVPSAEIETVSDKKEISDEAKSSTPLLQVEAIFDELKSAGVPLNSQIERIVRTSELVALTTAIQILKAKRRRGDRVENPAGFFIRAVRERWKPEPTEVPTSRPAVQPLKFTLAELKRIYPRNWRDAAAHFGIEIEGS